LVCTKLTVKVSAQAGSASAIADAASNARKVLFIRVLPLVGEPPAGGTLW
jgi:hypothetical protein